MEEETSYRLNIHFHENWIDPFLNPVTWLLLGIAVSSTMIIAVATWPVMVTAAILVNADIEYESRTETFNTDTE